MHSKKITSIFFGPGNDKKLIKSTTTAKKTVVHNHKAGKRELIETHLQWITFLFWCVGGMKILLSRSKDNNSKEYTLHMDVLSFPQKSISVGDYNLESPLSAFNKNSIFEMVLICDFPSNSWVIFFFLHKMAFFSVLFPMLWIRRSLLCFHK